MTVYKIIYLFDKKYDLFLQTLNKAHFNQTLFMNIQNIYSNFNSQDLIMFGRGVRCDTDRGKRCLNSKCILQVKSMDQYLIKHQPKIRYFIIFF